MPTLLITGVSALGGRSAWQGGGRRAGVDVEQIERFGWATEQQALLAELFYRHVAAEDVEQRPAAAIVGPVTLLAGHASLRRAGEASVRVTSPDWIPRTVLTVINDDMAFLVDSVSAELTRLGVGMHLVVHPLVTAERDEEGQLLRLAGPLDGARAEGRVEESWMYVEIDRQHDQQSLDLIERHVTRILGDVRAAVSDWPAMVNVARRLATDLAARSPVGVSRQELSQTIDLLRWLAADQFTFLGYREYGLTGGTEEEPDLSLVSTPGSGLGLLRSAGTMSSKSFADLPAPVRRRALEPRLLIVTKANRHSTVHRPVYLDYVGVKIFDDQGAVIGEHRFIGLLTASAYTQSVTGVPVIDRKVRRVRRALGLQSGSHAGRDLMTFLETFPRDELFGIEIADLIAISDSALNLKERRATRLFVWKDRYLRFLSCLIYVPRDRYSTDVRIRIQREVMATVGGAGSDFTARVTESVLARLHLVVRMPRGQSVPDVDVPALEERIASLARSWEDDLARLLGAEQEPEEVARILAEFPLGFPDAYQALVTPHEALADLRQCALLGPQRSVLASLGPARDGSGAHANVALKLYSTRDVALADVVPVLTSMGAGLVTERPFRLSRRNAQGQISDVFVYDFGLMVHGQMDAPEQRGAWEEALLACWQGRAEIDGLNQLVATAGLSWRQVVILRTYVRYLRQVKGVYDRDYIEAAVLAYPDIGALLVSLFELRLDPSRVGDSAAAADSTRTEIDERLEKVVALDHDRILRLLRDLIRATVRTNHFQPGHQATAIKLTPQHVKEVPEPRPLFEIWVCSPRFDGIHLRFGPVARGGLRWSDRREDLRTEVLGLARAQAVKNALIVPAGAKGGFVAKAATDPSLDRAGWLAEGVACYRLFVSAMLDVTDNLVGGTVVPPAGVHRRDGDDPYLVVAADKGTATFSDIANEIAIERGFWLGDAFASGGSAGYDHKAMGITARGAWESVRAHIRRVGMDADRDPISVVGIGDMSGDVFGNGMLLSPNLRLVAAFDHRHVFLDPDPDAQAAHAERRRLFDMPRSSWLDYDAALISPGGGVHSRAAKSVPVSARAAAVLGIARGECSMTPAELIRAILTAPVDLLWSAGIGTFVKSSAETHAQVGDRANDGIRIDGRQLRARVVAEGGNLGLTQLGRIEAARTGVLLNTDAIDNSAGVDTSDHEVNIKILLDRLTESRQLERSHRLRLLTEVSDDVAELVLRHNRSQNTTLAFEEHHVRGRMATFARLLRLLERDGRLDRELESLPDEAALAELAAAGMGLTTPELAVLLAHTKLHLRERLLDTSVLDEPFAQEWLTSYFPAAIGVRLRADLRGHPLRREITATALVNELVDRSGMTFVLRAGEETGATVDQIVRAYAVTTLVFDLRTLWERIDPAGQVGDLSLGAANSARIEAQRLLDRASRWLLVSRGATLDVAAETARFSEVAHLAGLVPDLMGPVERERLDRRTADLSAAGLPADLAPRVAALLDAFSLLDVVEIGARCGVPADEVAGVYFTLSERFAVDALLNRISDLPRDDRWAALARAGLRADLYGSLAALTERVVGEVRAPSPLARVQGWEARYSEGLSRAQTTLAEIHAGGVWDLATISVALRILRSLAALG